jgi:hypothetical protein
MKMRVLLFLCIGFAAVQLRANGFTCIEEAWKDFSRIKKYENLLTPGFVQKIDKKNSFVELVKEKTTIQFGRYEGKDNEYVYVFNYFSDSSFYKPGISVGCYKYINNVWVEVTDVVMPMLSFNDFYGNGVVPPKTYVNTVQFRFILHKSNLLHIVIEPNMNREDPKFDRIFDSRKYAAAQTRWNRNEERFEIVKWLK